MRCIIFGVGLEERLGLREILGAAAFDEVAGERPRRTGETEGLVQAELFAENRQGVVDVLQAVGGAGELERVDIGGRSQGALHRDAAFVAETVADAEGLGNHQDVQEQDRGVSCGKRRSGWRVTSTARSGVRTMVTKSDFALRARYSGR
jgi:hypothetical protein